MDFEPDDIIIGATLFVVCIALTAFGMAMFDFF